MAWQRCPAHDTGGVVGERLWKGAGDEGEATAGVIAEKRRGVATRGSDDQVFVAIAIEVKPGEGGTTTG